MAAGPAAAQTDPHQSTTPDYADLPMIVAEELSLFAKNAVEGRLRSIGSVAQDLMALRNSEIDFTTLGLAAFAEDLARDPAPGEPNDPVILASLGQSTDYEHVVAYGGDAVTDPSWLRGHRVGVPNAPDPRLLWATFSSYYGLAPQDVEVVDIDAEEAGDRLAGGDVQAVVTWQPFTARLKRRFGEKAHIFSVNHLYTSRWVLVTRRELVEASAETCSRVLAALGEAIEQIEADPALAGAIFADYAGLDTADTAALEGAISFDLSVDWSLIAELQHRLAWLAHEHGKPVEANGRLLDIIRIDPLATVTPSAARLPGALGARHRGAP
ncbi:ABC transporter substrate-binding protein [Acuticoccus mangrovi]|uniref:ABC transporter substrate-binding protein n=1 Tax=Acuticoccus mangrovi TaxID=2796142 RepID=A0A934IQP6_9HYPH|nr:ABC transporter substrate-binding protein [Acuticoccus mangrovi]MBJ3776295.1 ABC transporter substrate-binding protein [Acuticoccus mangrovi]